MEYGVAFAGARVMIHYEGEEVHAFLSLLFEDQQAATGDLAEAVLAVERRGGTGDYRITVEGVPRFQGRLGVGCAAMLYDAVIFHLLNANQRGLALHAGAVARGDKVILLPGQSGYGKSSMTAWLTSLGLSYHSDELVFLPDGEGYGLEAFTRPICIKAAAAPVIKGLLPDQRRDEPFQDEQGMLVPHRMLNPDFQPGTARPGLILFPCYQAGATARLEKISSARAATALMACDINGRNLDDHGFGRAVTLARQAPAFRLSHGGFPGLSGILDELFTELWMNECLTPGSFGDTIPN